MLLNGRRPSGGVLRQQLSFGNNNNNEYRPKRAPFIKQFSQDLPDWPVKLAWPEAKPRPLHLEDEEGGGGGGGVVITKCQEVRRVPPSERENGKAKPEPRDKENHNHHRRHKPNLEIYLAPREPHQETPPTPPPKYLQPLQEKTTFQIRKTKDSATRATCRNAVAPATERRRDDEEDGGGSSCGSTASGGCIDVVVRPLTAAQSRRERFQKRNNSAFHGTAQQLQPQQLKRPPLIRSASAPNCGKTSDNKGKFLATKQKLKGAKKPKSASRHRPNGGNVEWKKNGGGGAAAVNGSEIVTMVSLVSPSGSDNEEDSEPEEARDAPKSALKRDEEAAPKIDRETLKNVSLRKIVKSVSFQQSSIHAVRSFSASFPARRAVLPVNNEIESKIGLSTKMQEKRTTNPASSDGEETVPKRRLTIKDNSESSAAWRRAAAQIGNRINNNEIRTTFKVDIQVKSEPESKYDLEENAILIMPDDETSTNNNGKGGDSEAPDMETPKEKQCWEMYCKMTKKGINVSYDTILRGMLTPTEYRIRRKTSLAEEINMLVNAPSEADASSKSE